MNIYAVVAHDKKKSLTHQIFNHVVTHCQQSATHVKAVDLYDYAQHIPFYTHDRTILEKNTFYQSTKQEFMNADRLIIVFPVYWYSTPGIMKCWIDLITSYAYSYNEGIYAKPLHHIKKVLIIQLTMNSWWHNTFFWADTARKQVSNTFRFMGIENITSYTVDKTQKITPAKIAAHLKKIERAAQAFLLE